VVLPGPGARPPRCLSLPGSSKTTPGWEYQLAAVTGYLRTAWAAVDVQRTTPATRTTQTVAQVKAVLRRLPASGAVPLFVFDAGYSAAALTDGLAGCPADVLVRLRLAASSTRTRPPGRARTSVLPCAQAERGVKHHKSTSRLYLGGELDLRQLLGECRSGRADEVLATRGSSRP
jgi:hypothetical protein